MARELIFHVGDLKTGSTSIQHMLTTGSVKCDTKKLFYPSRHLLPIADLFPGRHQQNQSFLPKIVKKLHQKRQISGGFIGEANWVRRRLKTAGYQDLFALISQSNADICIISAAEFQHTEPEVLKFFIDQYFSQIASTVRVIAYVRPHADNILSWFCESVKNGWFFGDLEEYYARPERNFTCTNRFLKWRAVFGENFTLRPMIRKHLHKNCVVRDFMHLILCGEDFDLTSEPKSNISLTLEDLAVARHLQSALKADNKMDRCDFGWEFQRLIDSTALRHSGTKVRLHKDLATDVVQAFSEDAKRLDAEFFGGQSWMLSELEASVERAIETPQSLRIEDHFAAGELRIIQVLSNLVVEMFDADPKFYKDRFKKLNIEALQVKEKANRELTVTHSKEF